MGNIQNFNEQSFEQEVIKNQGVSVVDFWAEWCGPCKMIAPLIEEVATKYEGKVTVGKVNVDETSALASKYNVMSIPTLIFFKGGEVVDQVSGVVTQDVISAKLDKLL